ncbi:MAG: RNA 2',3'-cyclic phosphodiesterase [Candidatus Woesearchaeota archaeon]
MRLFVAVGLPKEVSEHLHELAVALASEPSAKVALAAGSHLTLKFLGEQPEEKLEEIKSLLSEISFEPFEGALNGIGWFPGGKRMRVIWIGIKPEEAFSKLQQKVESSLKSFGKAEERAFSPHITLARVKAIFDKAAFAKAVTELGKRVKQLRFVVTSFSLMKSTLTKKGAVYEELAKFVAKA